jgi:hypothetical protein
MLSRTAIEFIPPFFYFIFFLYCFIGFGLRWVHGVYVRGGGWIGVARTELASSQYHDAPLVLVGVRWFGAIALGCFVLSDDMVPSLFMAHNSGN